MYLSVVSPVYRAENIIDELYNEIVANVSVLTDDFEIILVEDGSPDNSWAKIVDICKADKRVKGIRLSRNFGQHYAITAGLQKSSGDWIVVMDCDLQDRPDQIHKLMYKAKQGFDIVFAQRVKREDKFFKKWFSKWFYRTFSYLTDTEQDSSIANFGIYSKQVVQAILEMKDQVRFFPTMSNWVGFNKTTEEVKHSARAEGKSSYTFVKLLNLAFDNIISFSDKPLWLVIRFGFLISFFSFLFGIYFILKYFIYSIQVVGYTSLIVSVWFLSGILLFTLGLIGVYLGKTFDQGKGRPIYIIQEILN